MVVKCRRGVLSLEHGTWVFILYVLLTSILSTVSFSYTTFFYLLHVDLYFCFCKNN